MFPPMIVRWLICKALWSVANHSCPFNWRHTPTLFFCLFHKNVIKVEKGQMIVWTFHLTYTYTPDGTPCLVHPCFFLTLVATWIRINISRSVTLPCWGDMFEFMLFWSLHRWSQYEGMMKWSPLSYYYAIDSSLICQRDEIHETNSTFSRHYQPKLGWRCIHWGIPLLR